MWFGGGKGTNRDKTLCNGISFSIPAQGPQSLDCQVQGAFGGGLSVVAGGAMYLQT